MNGAVTVVGQKVSSLQSRLPLNIEMPFYQGYYLLVSMILVFWVFVAGGVV